MSARLTRSAGWRALAAVLALLLAGCGPRDEPFYQQRLLAFGTLVDVSLWGVDADRATEAFRALGEEFNWMHQAWHAWRPSTVTRLNRQLQSGEPFAPDPGVLPLVEISTRLALASGHLFNPAIGRLIALWGYQADAPGQAPPPPEVVAELVRQAPRMDDIVREGDALRCRNPAVQLDFGGFAKGYGVDRAVERLQALGVGNAVVAAAGDVRAIGRRGDRPWRIGIRHPRAPGVLASIEIEGDENVSTSGDYERYFEHEGRRYHHIVDPRTGYPAQGTASVTVVTHGGALADAGATALFVAGPEGWARTAAALGIDQVLLVASDGAVHLTPAMAARVRFETTAPPSVRVQGPSAAPEPPPR